MCPSALPLPSRTVRPRSARPSTLALLALLFALAVTSSCSTTGQFANGGEISKVKITKVDPNERVAAADRSIPMEQQFRLHGAIDGAERAMVAGNYYEIFWRVDDRSQPVTLRFEYRTRAAGMEPFTQELFIDQPKRRNITTVSVVGEELLLGEGILSWRASLLQGDRVIATSQSHLWD